ncbi:MAG: hypothetical protein R2849_03550 [Thermomicrobiales bacterium]
MIPFIIRRLILIVPVMLIVGTITFLLLHVTPGDPAAVMLGPDATPAQVEQLRDDSSVWMSSPRPVPALDIERR